MPFEYSCAGVGMCLTLLMGLHLLGNASAQCSIREFSVTVDDYMTLYVDEVPITGLPNAFHWEVADTVTLTCATRVIAIQGTNLKYESGIRASDSSGYILTNNSWKCTNMSYPGWEKIDFDDSSWPDAVVTGYGSSRPIPGINPDSVWIWSSEWFFDEIDFETKANVLTYCRKHLAVNECALDPPYNQCNSTAGTCEDTTNGYNCHCFNGYTNTNAQTCEDIDECLLEPPFNVCDPGTQLCINRPGSYICVSC